jgi:hypothetical protein
LLSGNWSNRLTPRVCQNHLRKRVAYTIGVNDGHPLTQVVLTRVTNYSQTKYLVTSLYFEETTCQIALP